MFRSFSISGLCGVRGVASWTATRTPTSTSRITLIQHFVAVKVDFDASPKLLAQLQQAQVVLNPAGLPLTSFITPDGRLYFGAGYLPAEHRNGKPSFREAADEALARFANRSKVEEQSFQLELEK